jgi:hypothetical protein
MLPADKCRNGEHYLAGDERKVYRFKKRDKLSPVIDIIHAFSDNG